MDYAVGWVATVSALLTVATRYNVPAMTAIRFGRHFATLAVAAVIFWFAKDFYLPYWLVDFDYFHFALMGALHATCIVVSLRYNRVTRPTIAFPIYALCFIVLVTVMSAATPILAIFGSIVWEWAPLIHILQQKQLGGYAIYLTGSAIGASGYWLLVRMFWLKLLRRAAWLKTVLLCLTATLLVELIIGNFDEHVHPVNPDIFSPILTVAWWFAFSISLYWSEKNGRVNRSTLAVETVT